MPVTKTPLLWTLHCIHDTFHHFHGMTNIFLSFYRSHCWIIIFNCYLCLGLLFFWRGLCGFFLPMDHGWFIYSFCHDCTWQTVFLSHIEVCWICNRRTNGCKNAVCFVKLLNQIFNFILFYYDGSVTFTCIVSISLRDCQVYLIIEKNIPRVKQN